MSQGKEEGLTCRPPLVTDFVESLTLKIGQTCPVDDIGNGSRIGEEGLRCCSAPADTTACNDVQHSRSRRSDTPYERALVNLNGMENWDCLKILKQFLTILQFKSIGYFLLIFYSRNVC